MTDLALPPRTALGELAAAIRDALAGEGDWAATADRVRAVLADPLPSASMLPARLRAGSPDGYVSEPVHVEPDGSFSIVAFVCRQAQVTAIHDHVTWCVFAVLAGTPVEELFRLDDARTGLVAAGYERCATGTVGGGAPPGDIHRLGNPNAETAVSLHVYGTDVSRIGSSVRRMYDLPIRSRRAVLG
ncbi:MAG: 3-mercaptopropionate dioxygenase [Solirubrobacteraceae bacterium]|jgi:predicted metal-dependent enzyme (double-stranded beta helix superfamily)|nr:3-mercaptopropionate dioxygenase [Solirubrobacteraceae bacterium]